MAMVRLGLTKVVKGTMVTVVMMVTLGMARMRLVTRVTLEIRGLVMGTMLAATEGDALDSAFCGRDITSGSSLEKAAPLPPPPLLAIPFQSGASNPSFPLKSPQRAGPSSRPSACPSPPAPPPPMPLCPKEPVSPLSLQPELPFPSHLPSLFFPSRTPTPRRGEGAHSPSLFIPRNTSHSSCLGPLPFTASPPSALKAEGDGQGPTCCPPPALPQLLGQDHCGTQERCSWGGGCQAQLPASISHRALTS